MRIDQLLAPHYSRKVIKQALAQYKIRIDGQVAQKLGQNVDPGLQEIQIAGQPFHHPGHHYFLLHKTRTSVTANRDAKHPTVFDSLAKSDRHPNLYAVGRLDRDTSGLLLLTDNGPLGYQMLHPQAHVEKTYQVWVNGPLHQYLPDLFAAGIIFADGRKCQPAQLSILSSSNTFSQAMLTIKEGKFHQVKKMFLSVGLKVIRLVRVQFGPFQLDETLPYGAYRRLTSMEETQLKILLQQTR